MNIAHLYANGKDASKQLTNSKAFTRAAVPVSQHDQSKPREECCYTILCETGFISPLAECLIVISSSFIAVCILLHLLLYMFLSTYGDSSSVLFSHGGGGVALAILSLLIPVRNTDISLSELVHVRSKSAQAAIFPPNKALKEAHSRMTVVVSDKSDAVQDMAHRRLNFNHVALDSDLMNIGYHASAIEGKYHTLVTTNAYIFGIAVGGVANVFGALVYYIFSSNFFDIFVITIILDLILLCICIFKKWRDSITYIVRKC